MQPAPDPITLSTAAPSWMPQLVLDMGRPAFHASLLQGLHDSVGAAHISQLRYERDGRIGDARCASLVDQSMIERTTDTYVNRLHQRDPNYALVRASGRRPAPGVQLITVPREDIHDAEYRRLLFDRPGFACKVSLISTRDDATCYINLYFSRPVSAQVTALLLHNAPMLVALAQRHGELASQEAAAELPAEFLALSTREREVAELLWQGLSAKEVARALGLSPTTVLTYKTRLFEKVRVATLKEFLLKAPARQSLPASAGTAAGAFRAR